MVGFIRTIQKQKVFDYDAYKRHLVFLEKIFQMLVFGRKTFVCSV
jgi:hypothetical protein